MPRYINETLSPYTSDPATQMHFGKIKINSGEDFVPLYLALFSTSPVTYYPQSYGRGVKPDAIKTYLENVFLNTPDLKEYSFSVPYQALWPGDFERYRVFQGNHTNLWGHSFSGTATSLVSHFVTLGLWARVQGTMSGSTLAVKAYAGARTVRPVKIDPEVLILVKAKHLKYIATCITLQAPMTQIPYLDIKLLRLQNINNEAAHCFVLANTSGMKVEYVTPEVMAPYLMKPFAQQHPEQLLANTRKVLSSAILADAIA